MLGDHRPPGFAPSRIKRLNHVDLDLCVTFHRPPCSVSGPQFERASIQVMCNSLQANININIAHVTAITTKLVTRIQSK